jgi:hypothetical protein
MIELMVFVMQAPSETCNQLLVSELSDRGTPVTDICRAVRIYDFGPPEPYKNIYGICTVCHVYPYTMPPQIRHLSPHWANLSKIGTGKFPLALVFV